MMYTDVHLFVQFLQFSSRSKKNMIESDWKSVWIRGGNEISDVGWIGKDILVWCSGMHIIFYNVATRQEIVQRCSTREISEGASCISTLPETGVYAFAEKCPSPRILVYVYPLMQKVAECITSGGSAKYLSTAFAGHEHLVSLSSYPEFVLTVWLWRTGTKVASIKTWISDDVQILKASVHEVMKFLELNKK